MTLKPSTVGRPRRGWCGPAQSVVTARFLPGGLAWYVATRQNHRRSPCRLRVVLQLTNTRGGGLGTEKSVLSFFFRGYKRSTILASALAPSSELPLPPGAKMLCSELSRGRICGGELVASDPEYCTQQGNPDDSSLPDCHWCTLLPFVTTAAASPSYIETATTTLAAGRMQQDNLTDHKHLTTHPLNHCRSCMFGDSLCRSARTRNFKI